MKQGQLLLWGEVAVGKSTLLAAGLLGSRRLSRTINAVTLLQQKESSQTWDRVVKNWQALLNNRSSLQTEGVSQLQLPLVNGNFLTIRDVQGIMTREVLEEDSFRQPGATQGVLFVCEWHGSAIASQLRAIREVLPHCHDRKFGLALTKSERGLDAYDPHWQAPLGWWREHDCWIPYADVLTKFEDRMWPTSAFGFTPDGRPACLLNEFGEIVPFNVQPRNVDTPFLWFLKELCLWTE